MRRAIEDHAFPHFVAEQSEIMRLAERAQRLQLRARRDRAGGVVGRVEDDQPGAGRDRRFQFLHRDGPVRRHQIEQLGRAACSLDQRQIGVITGLQQDRLVPRLDQGEDAGGQCFGRAGSDHHFLFRNLQPLFAQIIVAHRAAQFGQAAHGRILVRFLHQRAPGGFQQFGRMFPVGKTLAEIDRACLPREGGHAFEDGGRGSVAHRLLSEAACGRLQAARAAGFAERI